MENRKWQEIPGLAGSYIYPYLRAPDVLSSNAFLIEFPDWLMLIDPGALPAQTGELRKVVSDRLIENRKPLGIFLTHCHIDHSREAPAFLGDPVRPTWLAAQEEGAAVLADGDCARTIADLYGLDMPRMSTHLPLLSAEDCQKPGSRNIRLAGNTVVQLCTEQISDPGFAVADSPLGQTLRIGSGGPVDIFPCPGHSPDSICIRMGELLFLGDLLVANRPLVAGVCGWDNQQLVQSLDLVIRLLQGDSVQWCLPGHGSPIPAEKTLAILKRQREGASRFENVAAMDATRLHKAVDMGLELIDEAEEAYSAIAGRLLYVADRLDYLEEPDAAVRCRQAMDMDQVEALLDRLRSLCRSLAAEETLQVQFANDAAGIVEKLRNSFVIEPLSEILPKSMINRVQRLVLDFLGIARGSRNLEEFLPVDLSALLSEVEQTWRDSPHLDPSIFDWVEDDRRFAAELARRIGHPPVGSRIAVAFAPAVGAPPVRVAPVRFCDTLMQFFEWLGLAGATSLQVDHRVGEDTQTIEIRPSGWAPDDSDRVGKKLKSYSRRFALAGFQLSSKPDSLLLVL